MVYQERELKVLIGGPGFMVEEYVQIVKERFSKINVFASPVLVETAGNQVQGKIEDVDVMASFNAYPYSMPRMKKLKWFQVLMTGYEHILRTGLIRKDIILTNSAGTVSIPIAEVVMGYLLFFVKKFRESLDNQRLHKMDRMLGQMRELHQRTMGLLGLGHIGKVIAKKAKLGFDMEVLGYDKYVKEFEYADRIYPDDQLDELLKISDFVVISLPHTPETNRLIGERELKLMKPTAFLVNLARGEILIKRLTRALKEG
jgi:phosphoglycerate dehydrogenase-like enzyme